MKTSIGLMVAAFWLMPGCASPENSWQEAMRQNTVPAYQPFLKDYPTRPKASAAQAKIAELQEQSRASRAKSCQSAREVFAEWKKTGDAAVAFRLLQICGEIEPELGCDEMQAMFGDPSTTETTGGHLFWVWTRPGTREEMNRFAIRAR